MRIIDFTFQGMSPIYLPWNTPVICMSNGGQKQMQYLTLVPLYKKINFGKNQIKPYSAAHEENINRF